VQQPPSVASFGAEHTLIALGLVIVFSLMGLANFAPGEVSAIGSYGVFLLLLRLWPFARCAARRKWPKPCFWPATRQAGDAGRRQHPDGANLKDGRGRLHP